MATLVKLDNPIQSYAWGSLHAIAELQGRPAPTGAPEAELWIGDHPRAPSKALAGGHLTSLSDWIAANPDAVLGPRIRQRYGDSLPFLVKLIAVARPLSIQVHPNAEQAREGYTREGREGIPVDSPRRSYCDPNPKSEMLIALTRFSALSGFRDDTEVSQFLEGWAGRKPGQLLVELAAGSETAPLPLAAALLRRLLELDRAAALALCHDIRSFSVPTSRNHDATAWVSRLCRQHPEDPTAMAPLLLNLVTLEPGQALVVRPGTVHCYLEGFGVEVMTRSDNVVRGGLSGKHIDPEQFLLLASPHTLPPEVIGPEALSATESRYQTAAPEFEVTVEQFVGSRQVIQHVNRGPRVLLCVAGRLEIEAGDDPTRIELAQGESALLPACVGEYRLRGNARLFSVTTGAAD